MSSATARAEARRKAILSRGSDRLAKLTTSARGDEKGLYDDPPLPRTGLSTFLGEDSPTPPASTSTSSLKPTSTTSPSPSPRSNTRASASSSQPDFSNPDPSVWSEAQQEQFMAALMGGTPPTSSSQPPPPSSNPSNQPPNPFAAFMGGAPGAGGFGGADPNANPFAALQAMMANMPPPPAGGFADLGGGGDMPAGAGMQGNPFAALMGGMGGMGGGPGGPGAGFGGAEGGDNPFAALMQAGGGQAGNPFAPAPVAPPSKMKKWLPLVHLVSMIALIVFFVQRSILLGGVSGSGEEGWGWWASLGSTSPGEAVGIESGAGVGSGLLLQFFYAFLTLQLALHSLRIFSGFDAIQPHPLLAMALPALPAPIPSLVMTALKWAGMVGVVLDDLSVVVVGVGLVVWASSFVGPAGLVGFGGEGVAS